MEFIFLFFLAALVGYWASRRGRNGWLWGGLALAFTPLITGVILVLLPNLAKFKMMPSREKEHNETADSVEAAEVASHTAADPLVYPSGNDGYVSCDDCEDYDCDYRDDAGVPEEECPRYWDDGEKELPGGGTLRYYESDDAIFPGDHR